MSPQSKLTFRNISLKNLILIVIITSISLIFFFTTDSCGIRHMQILNEMSILDESFDPEQCEVIVEKIDLFNDSCEPQIEILDCS